MCCSRLTGEWDAGGVRQGCKEAGLRVYRYPLSNLNTVYRE